MNPSRKLLLPFVILLLAGCARQAPPPAGHELTRIPEQPTSLLQTANLNMKNLIPKPVSVMPAPGVFILNATTGISVSPPNDELLRIGNMLADSLKRATGLSLPVSAGNSSSKQTIYLTLAPDTGLGDEGYTLTINPTGVTLSAPKPAGLFYGVQTLLQLLPAPIEDAAPEAGPHEIPAGVIRDYPRFAWRGTMLDVARHFFGAQDVKRYVDELAAYKLNHLHLHLSDDQGWRIEIKSLPRLASYGGSTQVGGGAGGYYTQAEYRELVTYAAERYITIVPEIDMPGHTNAALASYAELNCDDTTPALYTGTEVGFSTLCVDKGATYEFLDDVIRELAALTPGPYLHIGGDEARSTEHDAYLRFIERIEPIVRAHGKEMMGWEEIAQATLAPTSVVQNWLSQHTPQGVKQGAHVVMSPASKSYLDMKYDASTKLGLDWAGLVSVATAYNWDPATELEGVGEKEILGVEAPLWSETLTTLDDIEYMAFPRLIGIAEMGWTPQAQRDWTDYVTRLSAHGPRLKAMGVNFFADPQVPWQ